MLLVDRDSRLPLYCRTIVESSLRRRRHETIVGCVYYRYVPWHGARAGNQPRDVRLCGNFRTHAVLWVAREAGLFEKNALRTEVAYIRSGSTMSQTLVAGEIQMAQMGGPAMLAAGVAGMDVTFVAVAMNPANV